MEPSAALSTLRTRMKSQVGLDALSVVLCNSLLDLTMTRCRIQETSLLVRRTWVHFANGRFGQGQGQR
jgi:hypothetical protein